MTALEVVALVGVGVAGGLISTVASIASIVSYPALLAFGLPPLSANMTNTVALLFTGVGAAAGSRPELAGQGARVRRLGPVASVGGGAGAALLLVTPPGTFQRAAPVLIGAASLVLLVPRLGGRGTSERKGARAPGGVPGGQRLVPGGQRLVPGGQHSVGLLACLFGAAMYIGYFGAAGGILLLAVLATIIAEPLARANAVKNVLSGLTNTVAAVAFAVLGRVDWAVVPPLAAGFLIGGWTGPALVRRLPGRVMRVGVALCGLGVAVKLGVSAYR